jgi:uncharacterized protein
LPVQEGGPLEGRDGRANGTPAGLFSGPPQYVARTPWTPLRALVAGVLVVGLGIVAAILLVGEPHGPAGRTRAALWRPPNPEMAAMATLAAWQLSAVLLTILASTMYGARCRDVLALRPPAGAPGVYLRALFAMAVLEVVLSAIQYSLVTRDIFADSMPFYPIVAGSGWPLAFAVVGIGAPLSEELLFRGFLLSALARTRLGFSGAALATTMLWTGLHAGYSLAGITEVFAIGLFFCWLLWRTGSLRTAIVCHALYNTLILLVLRYVVSAA